jgi:hypothetical protein
MHGRHRRVWIILIVCVVALVLLAPLLAGYFGPKAAAYAQTWRPWRSHLGARNDLGTRPSANQVLLWVEYSDPWPGQARTPGVQVDFQTVTRVNRLLPWFVSEHGTGGH